MSSDPPADADDRGDVTRALGSLADGEAAPTELLELLHAELRRAAAQQMRGERDNHTLQPTALVHEAWLKLTAGSAPTWESRAHFLRAAAQAMRRILIDHARSRSRCKRGAGSVGPLEDWVVAIEARQLDVLALDEALHALEAADPHLARLVDLRFFAGLTIDETAAALECSTSSVERDWRIARSLLRRLLEGAP